MKVRLLIIGVGGYAHQYLKNIQVLCADKKVTLAAYVEPTARSTKFGDWFNEHRVQGFSSVDDFLLSGLQVDLAIVCSPIAFHAEHSCKLLQNGINVLCEKPIASTSADAMHMQIASEGTGKFLEIGYQWCFSHAIQSLKAMILQGKLGAPQKLMTQVSWPRYRSYYQRNDWAGMIRDSRGAKVYDSPVSNAQAHYLFNMLYLLGESVDKAAMPLSIEAELYRVNPITNFDAACCRIHLDRGVELMFYAAHSVKESNGPNIRFEFEEAVVDYNFKAQSDICVNYKNGTVVNLGNPDAQPFSKLTYCVERCQPGNDLLSICSPQAAITHTYCVEALQEMPVDSLSDLYVAELSDGNGDLLLYGREMDEAICKAYSSGVLFSEMNLKWAGKKTSVDLVVA